MADLILPVDTGLTVPLNMLPIMQDDGTTIEQALVYNFAGLALQWNFVTAAGVFTSTAVTATTAGNYDITEPLANVGMYGIEIPASGGASANNDTEGFGWWTGSATGLLPWRGPVIQFSPANVVNSLVAGTDKLDVNAAELGGTAQTGRDVGASVLLSSGTGTGQVSISSGRVDANATYIAGSAVSTSTAQLGVNVVNAGGTAWGSGAITSGAFATGAIAAGAIAADAIGASELAADAVTEIVNAIKAAVVEAEGSVTVQQALSVMLSALAGVTASGGTVLKDPSGTATRITATVNGSNERTAITLTPSS